MRSAALILLLMCGACRSRTVWPGVPDLTCEWLIVGLDEGPEVQTSSGLTVEDLRAHLRETSFTLGSGDDAMTAELGFVGEPRVELVERTLPPNREVESAVEGVGCAEGELIRLQGVGFVDVHTADLGRLRYEGGGLVVEAAALDDSLWFDAFSTGGPWEEVPFTWRAAMAAGYPEGERPRDLSALVRIAGTPSAGAMEGFIQVRDEFDLVEETIPAFRRDWSAEP